MGAPEYIFPPPTTGGTPVGGTGTTNTIPRWTGPTTLGDSIITQSGSFIGIGTPSPSTRLHVSDNSSIPVIVQSSGSTDSYLRFINTSNNLGYIGYVGTNLYLAPNNGAGSVGIGTASPNAILSVYNASTPTISLWNSSNFSRFATNANDLYIDTGLGGVAGATVFRRGSGTVESARIDSSGNLILNTANTGATIQAAGSQQGLKLPNAPLNTDPNTLDSYREGTRVLAAGDLSGWTYVTATQYWTLVGRTVTLHTIFTGGTSSATGGATIATPPLLTPLRIAAGAAVNSSGTALGNGVCVVASTSSTTGTVITSNAISSSAVDKVLTVTYETAGL